MYLSITATESHEANRWLVLAVVVAAQFMFVVDAFIVNVAIPSIRTDLHATTSETQGVIVLYQIAFATLMITGGRLGDIRGPKPIFLIGLLGFTAASALCGLAQTGTELVIARAAQGAAAALMIPQVLATMHLLFPDEERNRAFGIFGFTLGFGAAVGFGLGGWLVAMNIAHLGWRAIFFVNLPVGAILMTAALRLMPPVAGKPGTRLDLLGAGVLFTALLCLIGPLVLGPDLGWGPLPFAVMLAGLLLLILMWPIERWVERSRFGLPLIHLDLLRDRGFTIGILTVYTFTFANISFYLVLTLYMQLGLHFSPLQSGLTVMPLAIAFAITSRLAGSRALLQGCGIQIVALATIALALEILPPLSPPAMAAIIVPFGIGQAMVLAPLYSLVLSKVPALHAGSGGGVITTIQQIGNSSGVAVIGAVFYAAGAATYALQLALLVLAIALTITATLLRRLR